MSTALFTGGLSLAQAEQVTFFFQEMVGLVNTGHLYLAMPPLYRITQGQRSLYARDDQHKDHLLKSEFKGNGKVEVSRFKGLGEMPPSQLKETTMDPSKRTLIRVSIPAGNDDNEIVEAKRTARLVDQLMGKNPEKRFIFIKENAEFAKNIDV